MPRHVHARQQEQEQERLEAKRSAWEILYHLTFVARSIYCNCCGHNLAIYLSTFMLGRLLDEESCGGAVQIKVAVVLAYVTSSRDDTSICPPCLTDSLVPRSSFRLRWRSDRSHGRQDMYILTRDGSGVASVQNDRSRGVAEKADAPPRSSPWLLLLKTKQRVHSPAARQPITSPTRPWPKDPSWHAGLFRAEGRVAVLC